MGIILLGLMWIIFVGPVILIDIQAYRGEGDSSFVKLVFMNTAGLFFGLIQKNYIILMLRCQEFFAQTL